MDFGEDCPMLKVEALVIAAGVALMGVIAISHEAFCIVLVKLC